ncbi:MAG: tRNA pseudouridine(38-40) synthase TruA [Halobacteriaceae archaeon]
MFAYRLAYDGRPYRGFQRQPTVSTVEDALFEALTALDIVDSPEEPPTGYTAAGRTDAGVSALAQTIAFEAPPWLEPAALNSRLPASIATWAREPVSADFHATHDATERCYTYFLHAPSGDIEQARAAAELLSGDHDFQHLTPATEGTRRTLSVEVERDGTMIVIECRAGGFVHELVRRIANLIDAVATGAATLGRVKRLLTSTSIDGPEGVGPAPADPLVLTDVRYPAVRFSRDGTVADRVAGRFGERAGAAQARGRALARIETGVGQPPDAS